MAWRVLAVWRGRVEMGLGVVVSEGGGRRGAFGTGDRAFETPYGIAVNSSGNAYVTDVSRRRVQKFDSSGSFLTGWRCAFATFGIAVDTWGNVFVADGDGNRVLKFDSSGQILTEWGSTGCGPGEFGGSLSCMGPRDIAFDSTGRGYVADTCNHRIQKFQRLPLIKMVGTDRALLEWGSMPGKVYRIGLSADLENWTYRKRPVGTSAVSHG